MIVSPIDVGKVASWAIWAWENREQLPSFPKDVGDYVVQTLQNGSEGVQRIGSTIVFGTPDAGQRVLGFLDQTSGDLHAIEAAIGGLQHGQLALSTSLASLQTISMVTLGLSAITPLVVAAQFRYLFNQFKQLKRDIGDLKKIVEAKAIAELEAAIGNFGMGVKNNDRPIIQSALMPCSVSVNFFSQRLGDAIEDRRECQLVLYLMRHLSVAICALARCHIALGFDADAGKALQANREILTKGAGDVFARTVAKNPSRYLNPQMSGDVSLEFLRSLFQQAHHAGIAKSEETWSQLVVESASTSRFFEALRKNIFRKRWWFGPRKSALRRELILATAAVEETNRVLSLETFLDETGRAGKKAIDVLASLDEEKQKYSRSPCVAWSF